MSLLGFPWLLVTAGIIFVIVYSIGEYAHVKNNNIYRGVGFAGTGGLILYVFWTYCPATAFQFVLPLFAAALVARFAIWVVLRTSHPA